MQRIYALDAMNTGHPEDRVHQRRLESCRPRSAAAPQVSEQARQTESAHNDIDVASQLAHHDVDVPAASCWEQKARAVFGARPIPG